MTRTGQLDFVDSMIDTVKEQITFSFMKLPEEWDGVELRWYIAEKFNEIVWDDYKKKNTKRYKDYHNEMIVKNL
jgi:hypothetical protein